jgi:hypothetical protein
LSASPSMVQQEIGFGPPPPRGESLDMRYTRWLVAHPDALREFATIARELLAEGETHLSVDFVVHIARYKQIIRRTPGEKYRINNSYTSRIARSLEASFPDLVGVFEKRELHNAAGAQ